MLSLFAVLFFFFDCFLMYLATFVNSVSSGCDEEDEEDEPLDVEEKVEPSP